MGANWGTGEGDGDCDGEDSPLKKRYWCYFHVTSTSVDAVFAGCADSEHEELADQAGIGVEVGGETSTLLKSACGILFYEVPINF